MMKKPELSPLDYLDIEDSSEYGIFIKNLTYQSKIEKVNELAKWDTHDEEKFIKLTKTIIDLELNDPMKIARRIRNFKERLNSLYQNIQELNSALSDDKLAEIKLQINNSNELKKAHEIASGKILSEPLPGVGENSWQFLYNAAKKYSEEFAYTDKKFPYVDEGSRCVLCMQNLDNSAKQRMLRFKDYMEQTSKKDYDDAVSLLNATTVNLTNTKILNESEIEIFVNQIEEKNEPLSKEVKKNYALLKNRHECFKKIAANIDIEIIPQISDETLSKLSKFLNDLEVEANNYEKLDKTAELDKLRDKKKKLISKKYFYSAKKNIIDQIEKLIIIEKYNNCIRETNTLGITKKGKDILIESLSPDLSEHLDSELQKLGVNYLTLNLISTGSKGDTLLQIEFRDKHIQSKMTEILSEGEQCVVAIAGFLAELNISDHSCPIVFDDPVSSLDHKFRDRIARRLVEESNKRQVIIFTHDIAFLFELRKTADEIKIYFTPRTIDRIKHIAGIIKDNLPWHAKNVKERISFMRSEIDTISYLFDLDSNDYNKHAGYLYGKLRETWEACIEEVVLNNTIQRYDSDVHTRRLRGIKVTNEIYRTIDINMSKCSEWMIGHDKSKSLDYNRPSPEDIKDDIKIIEDFHKSINKQIQNLYKERDEFLKAPKTSIG